MKYELTSGRNFNRTVVVIDEVDIFACAYNENVKKIKFTDEIAPKGATVPGFSDSIIDLSKDKDGSIVGWIEDDGVYKVSTQTKGQKIIFNENCDYMFEDCTKLKGIDFNFIDTSKVESMSSMFRNCLCLKELDLSSFDTSKVENMAGILGGCENLEELDLSSFDTSKVSSVAWMFDGCRNLKELDLSSFDTSKVERMSRMFSECINLERLDLSGFDTSKVKDMSEMFSCCKNLKELDLSSFDTSHVDMIYNMFDNTYNLLKERLNTSDRYILSEFKKEQAPKKEKLLASENINPKNLKLKDSKTKEDKENSFHSLNDSDNDIPF